jgi:hypothetical protein
VGKDWVGGEALIEQGDERVVVNVVVSRACATEIVFEIEDELIDHLFRLLGEYIGATIQCQLDLIGGKHFEGNGGFWRSVIGTGVKTAGGVQVREKGNGWKSAILSMKPIEFKEDGKLVEFILEQRRHNVLHTIGHLNRQDATSDEREHYYRLLESVTGQQSYNFLYSLAVWCHQMKTFTWCYNLNEIGLGTMLSVHQVPVNSDRYVFQVTLDEQGVWSVKPGLQRCCDRVFKVVIK